MHLPCCIICGEPIGGESTDWVHPQCAKGDGWDLTIPYIDWPGWAKVLVMEEHRCRDREQRRIEEGIEEVSVSDLPLSDRILYGEPNDDWLP